MLSIQNLDKAPACTVLSASRAIAHWATSSAPVRLATCHAALMPIGAVVPANATLYGNKITKYQVAWLAAKTIRHWSRPLEDFDTHQLVWFMSYFDENTQDWICNLTADYLKGLSIMSDAIPTETMTAISSHLDSIAAGLLTKDPMIPHHLRNTHQLLLSYPESRHLLSESQVATLISGLQYHTGIEIVKEKAATAKRSRAKLSADDL